MRDVERADGTRAYTKVHSSFGSSYISTNLISALHGEGVTGGGSGKVSVGSMARVINDVVRICLTTGSSAASKKKRKRKLKCKIKKVL